MKIRPVGAELFHADRQTNMTKLVVAFRSFPNAPQNVISHHVTTHSAALECHSSANLIKLQLTLQASPRSYLKALVTTTTDAPHQQNHWGDQEGYGEQRSKGCPYRHIRNICNTT
jgi:hypothetical protein